MHKDEDEGYLQDRRERGSICEAPSKRCEKLERREEVSEGRVGAVVGFGCLFLGKQSARKMQWLVAGRGTDVVVYGAEDLLGRNHQGHHLPDCHLEIHLRELEEALEEARHSQLASAGGGRAAEVGRTASRAR